LETCKWGEVARSLGHEIFYCAGQLDDDAPNPTLIPELHFSDPEAVAIGELVFGRLDPPPGLMRRIEDMTERIQEQLRAWL
ncbi:MAG: glycosyl transferase family 1, partial [Anaerolineae bacterium]|nr:glycosyl transferase family 1 [Anaerolineae bacterium]